MQIFDSTTQDVYESWQPFNDLYTINDQGWVIPDHDRLGKLSHHRAVIANCATEHWGADNDYPLPRRIHDIFQDHNLKNFLILTHDPGLESPTHRIHYFPFWFWVQSKNALLAPDTAAKKNFAISSLGGRPRPFRIANYLLLQKKSYQHRCITSLWNQDLQPDGYNDGFDLTQEELIYWQTVRQRLSTTPNDHFSILGIDHPAWTDAYLNLVNETTVKPGIFITEKTWKPIMSGQLFMIFGNAGIVAELRRLGFDVFDDLIDHSYDLEIDARSRLNKLHSTLDHIVNYNLEELAQHYAHRLSENWHKFKQHDSINQYLENFRNMLSL